MKRLLTTTMLTLAAASCLHATDLFTKATGERYMECLEPVDEDNPGHYYTCNRAAIELPAALDGCTADQVSELSRMILKQAGLEGTDATEALENILNLPFGSLYGEPEPSRPTTKPFSGTMLGNQDYKVKLTAEPFINNSILYTIHKYAYTGSGTGAGESSMTTQFIIPREPQAWTGGPFITRDNIFKPGTKRQLLSVLNEQIAIMRNIGEASCLNEGTTEEIPDMIQFSEYDISLVYPKYVIACGAAGNVAVSLSYEDLKTVLKPEAAAWLFPDYTVE